MTHHNQQPTFWHSLLAGGLAGTSVDLLFFPIDTIKTRLQSAQGFLRAGGFRGIYKGIGSVGVGSAPGAAAFFATYDTLKKNSPLSEDLAPLTHVISASAGEVVACLIRVPTEVIKTRTQTSAYASSLAAWQQISWRELYSGFGITVMREIPFTSIQFPLYEILKVQLCTRMDGQRPLYAHEAAACGSIAGAVAAAATTPLDVLKTRVMLDMRDRATQNVPSLSGRLKDLIRTEGPAALFAGVVPRTLWISGGGAIFLGVYEWAVHGLMVL